MTLKPFTLPVLLCWVWASPALADGWWGPDKELHLFVSAGVASTSWWFAKSLRLSDPVASGCALSLTLLVGGAKELVDLTGRGDPSWKDFTWDAIGAAVGVVLGLVIERLVPELAAPRVSVF